MLQPPTLSHLLRVRDRRDRRRAVVEAADVPARAVPVPLDVVLEVDRRRLAHLRRRPVRRHDLRGEAAGRCLTPEQGQHCWDREGEGAVLEEEGGVRAGGGH